MAKHLVFSSHVCSRCIRDTNQGDAEMQRRCVAIFGKRAPRYATDAASTRTDPFDRSKRCPEGHHQGEIRWSRVRDQTGQILDLHIPLHCERQGCFLVEKMNDL
ncbi:hypothetical protein BGW80DRAFT_1333638 [Lactifluus volemus]|nr:hypothetical protein BGW80DRAFT_1333638 [Lactifluus volemus]